MDGSGRNRADIWFANAADGLPRIAEAVVFDLDGTVLDTEGLYRRAFADALAELGYGLTPGQYDRLVGLSSPSRADILPSLLGAAFPVSAFFAVYKRCRRELLAGGIRLKPGVLQALDLLDRLDLPRAIATSASVATAHANLLAAGLAGRFDAVLTRDDVARGKPAPDIFAAAAAALRVPPHRCVAVEDSPHGLQAAFMAGLMTVMVPDALPATPSVLQHCTAVIGSLHELPILLGATGRETGSAGDRSRLRV